MHSDKYVVETPSLPDSEVAAVSGETVCQAQGHLLWPFAGFPESRIATASEHLVRKHQTGWPMARILQQASTADTADSSIERLASATSLFVPDWGGTLTGERVKCPPPPKKKLSN